MLFLHLLGPPSRPKFQPPQSEGAGRGLDPLLEARKHGAAPPHPRQGTAPPPHTHTQLRPPPSLKRTRQPDLGVGSRGARWRAWQSGARPDQGWASMVEGGCDSPPTTANSVQAPGYYNLNLNLLGP